LHVHVTTAEDNVLAAWEALEQQGIHTYFQTRAWCLSWLREVGPEIKANAVFVTGHRADGTIVFLLPLQIRRKYGFMLLEYLTAPHASYGFGLFEPNFLEKQAAAWLEENFDALLALLPHHDVVYLREMPGRMLGYANPLSRFARLKGANRAYMMALRNDFESLLAEKRSHETLRGVHKRDKRLTDLGDLKFGTPANAIERKVSLERMFNDQQQRLSETGVLGVYGPVERGFLSRLADPDQHGPSALIPYTLSLNGDPICVLLGGRACGVFWAMITSLAEGPWRKHSPGDYTLRRVIQAQCNDGLPWFDFSVGDSDYKLVWADTKIDMYLILHSSSLKGLALAFGLALKHATKRLFKSNVMLRDGAFALRKFAFGRNTKS
jgi:CelD/BcsL family acetyltransferase involved in cellulose biosynthesis